MRKHGGKDASIPAFILNFSRKLRDCYLSELAVGKVTCVTVSVWFLMLTPGCLQISMGKTKLQVHCATVLDLSRSLQ